MRCPRTGPTCGRAAGEWHADKFHGVGTYKWAEGIVDTGEFAHGFFEGKGTRRWPDGDMYCGDWVAEKQHGHGVYTYRSPPQCVPASALTQRCPAAGPFFKVGPGSLDP